ncbi:MAG: CoA transferase [Deltaproteobacteria bacterium]|nr:CoA transferase [Deltaproteobacteria bacterium]
MTKKMPLEGIRVLAITTTWSGPYATMLLGDLGAEVIRVESIQHFAATTRGMMARPPAVMYENDENGGYIQYPDRTPGEKPWNRCTFFNAQGRNKYGMTIDLERPKGLQVFKELLKISDILVENNAFGLMEKLGLTYDVVKEVNPRLIMIQAPGYGQKGPYRDWRGYGSQVEGVVGHTWLNQYSVDDIPRRSLTFTLDTVGGCGMALAALMALFRRKKTGRGQLVDLAQIQCVAPCLGEAYMDYTMNGRVQEAMGNRLPSGIQGCYRCAGEGIDEWIVITIHNDKHWEGLCRAMDDPPWTREEGFADGLSRYKNHDELDRHIEEWTGQRDKYDVMHTLQQAGVPAGPVMNERDAYNDRHLKERGFFLEITQKWCGTHAYPGFPWKFTRAPQSAYLPPPGLGEHNEYVCKKLLKMTDEEYAELEREQYIGDTYLPSVR